MNPFDCSLGSTKLYNLSSGVPVDETSCLGILSIKGDGEKRYHDFVDSRLLSEETKFHDPLTRSKYTLFKNFSRKVNMFERSGKLKAVEVNRNVFGTLLALSARSERLIDFQKALSYPLCFVSLSLANPDGSRRTTQKSKLSNVIYENSVVLDCVDLPPKTSVIAYLVDLMALIRTQTRTPATYEELVLQLFMAMPPGYKRIDIVADTYRHASMKDPERSKRGRSEAIIVRSGKSNIPQNFTKFLQNGENKTHLIELILSTLLEKRNETLLKLRSEEICFSTDGICHHVTRNNNSVIPELSSNQEEADTKLCLHTLHALAAVENGYVIVRNHSGDVDINVILIAKVIPESSRVILDIHNGKHRKALKLSDVSLTNDEKAVLIGFHSFTGNDYCSAFFGKEKQTCWKMMIKKTRNSYAFFQNLEKIGSSEKIL